MWMNVKTKDLVELGKTGPEGSVGLEEMARLDAAARSSHERLQRNLFRKTAMDLADGGFRNRNHSLHRRSEGI